MKPFLSVHKGPRSNLLGKKCQKILWHCHFKLIIITNWHLKLIYNVRKSRFVVFLRIKTRGGYTQWFDFKQREITPRGAKPCCPLKNWNLMLTFSGSRHCTLHCTKYHPLGVYDNIMHYFRIKTSWTNLNSIIFFIKKIFIDCTNVSSQRKGWSA